MWVTITVIFVVLGCLVFSIAVYGPEGYPITLMLGGLLAGYVTYNQNRRIAGKDEDDQS